MNEPLETSAKFKTIYLTGAPAAGKSTLTRALAMMVPSVEVFTYSAELRLQVATRMEDSELTQDDMRRFSAERITRQDVHETDQRLLAKWRASQGVSHFVVDSHAVTKESYGFRVTPFAKGAMQEFCPDVVVVLFASNDMTRDRIRCDPAGRPAISDFEAGFHTALQASLALQYSLVWGADIYYVESVGTAEEVAGRVAKLAKL